MFGDGIFVGKIICIIFDGYVSIYDVMWVVGVGDEFINIWNKLKLMFLVDLSILGILDFC